MDLSAVARSAIIIKSVLDGWWASRPTFKARPSAAPTFSPMHSRRRFASPSRALRIHCTTAPFNGTATTDYQAKIQWFGTVRGRLGALVTDRVLVYGTGGLAYGRVSKSPGARNVDGLLQVGSILTPGTSAFAAERTNVGFVVGGGIEGKIFANWTWKLEYLHLDLGSLELGDHIPSDCRERRCYSCRRHYDDAHGIHRRHRARRT